MPYKPKPFQRPGISLDRTPRTWGYTPVDEIQKGDTVVDFGLVQEVKVNKDSVQLTNVRDDKDTWSRTSLVYAFAIRG